MAFENLNVVLAIIGTAVSISFPFVLRYLNRKDIQQEKTSQELQARLEKYEERLRLAEIAIARTERNNSNGK